MNPNKDKKERKLALIVQQRVGGDRHFSLTFADTSPRKFPLFRKHLPPICWSWLQPWGEQCTPDRQSAQTWWLPEILSFESLHLEADMRMEKVRPQASKINRRFNSRLTHFIFICRQKEKEQLENRGHIRWAYNRDRAAVHRVYRGI